MEQVVRTWWPATKTSAAAVSRLRCLEAKNLIQICAAPAHPEIELKTPIVDWSPGDAVPDFGAISYRLHTRWREHPRRTVCISATRVAAARFVGHGGRFPREVERTHDIHVAAVYLLYRLRSPELLAGWQHEEEVRLERPRRGERLPDVVLHTAVGPRAVEFGGSYSKARLRAFHTYCEHSSLPYEVW